MKNNLLLFVVFLCVVSCGTGSCIKIGGGYQGIEGNVEYCFDGPKSAETGRVVLSDGKTDLTAFTIDDIQKILDKIKSKVGIKSAPDRPINPAKELVNILEGR
jgi:hypothetical protein